MRVAGSVPGDLLGLVQKLGHVPCVPGRPGGKPAAPPVTAVTSRPDRLRMAAGSGRSRKGDSEMDIRQRGEREYRALIGGEPAVGLAAVRDASPEMFDALLTGFGSGLSRPELSRAERELATV